MQKTFEIFFSIQMPFSKVRHPAEAAEISPGDGLRAIASSRKRLAHGESPAASGRCESGQAGSVPRRGAGKSHGPCIGSRTPDRGMFSAELQIFPSKKPHILLLTCQTMLAIPSDPHNV